MYGKPKPMYPPSDAQASEKLAHFVYEYLVFSGAEKAAQTFLQEIGWEKNILPNEAPGFLFSWWSVFWDLYCAAPERRDDFKHSNEARAFYEFPPGMQCGPVRGGGAYTSTNGPAPQGLMRTTGQQHSSGTSFYPGGGPMSQQQQQREAMLMQQQQQQQHQQQQQQQQHAMAARQSLYGGGPSRFLGGQPVPPQPHGDGKMGMPMMMMPGGIPEGVPFNPMEVQQQQAFLLGGNSVPNSGGGGNVFFRNIPSLPIASTPSVTLRHQPATPPYTRQGSLSRQPPPIQQQPMNGGVPQPSLNSSSSASSFSGSPNNNGLPAPTEHMTQQQQYNSVLQQQIYQQQQRGSTGKIPPRNSGQLNGMMSQQWNSGAPQQLQQISKQLLNQTTGSRCSKFQDSQEQQQQDSNFPLVFEPADINNMGGSVSGPPGSNSEIFDFYDSTDGSGCYLVSNSMDGYATTKPGGLLMSSSAMPPDLDNRLPLLLPEASSAPSSSSLVNDDRPPQIKSQICQLLSPSPAAFSCGRPCGAGGQQGNCKPTNSPLNQHPSSQTAGDPTGEQVSGLMALSSSELEMMEAAATAGDSPVNSSSMHWTPNMQQQSSSLGHNSIYQTTDDAEAVQNLVESMQDGNQQFCIENSSLFLQE